MMRYLDKYKNMSEPVKASMYFTICSFVQKGIALLTTPIFTRLLTTSEYGSYTIYQSWYAIAVIFCTLHIEHGAFNTGVIKFEDNKKQFVSSLIGLTSVLTFTFFIAIALLKFSFGLFSDVTVFMLVAMFLQIMFVPAFSVWSANERFNYRYKQVVLFTLAYAILNPLISIGLLNITNGGSDARIAGIVISQVLIGGYFFLYLIKEGKCLYKFEYWKFSIFFCLPLIPHYLSETILTQADRLMIASFIGESEAAIYAVAYTISTMVMYVSNAINQSFMPFLYKSIKSTETQKVKSIQKSLLILILFVCIVAMAFAPEILMVFATKDYSTAVNAIPPVVISTFFIFAYNHFSYVEMYYEKNIFVMIASLIAALVNVGLNALFIPLFGFVAAGYTTLISYILFCVLHYFMYKKILVDNKMEDLYDVKFFAVMSTIAVICTAGMQFIYSNAIIRYLVIVVLFFVCILFKSKIKSLFKSFKS